MYILKVSCADGYVTWYDDMCVIQLWVDLPPGPRECLHYTCNNVVVVFPALRVILFLGHKNHVCTSWCALRVIQWYVFLQDAIPVNVTWNEQGMLFVRSGTFVPWPVYVLPPTQGRGL